MSFQISSIGMSKFLFWNLDKSFQIQLKNSNPFWSLNKMQIEFRLPRSGMDKGAYKAVNWIYLI